VFPQATLWYNTSELLLIGGVDSTPRLEPSRLALLARDSTLARDLRYSPWGGPARWLNQPRELAATFLTGPEGLEALSRGAPVERDDRPVLEYATAHADEGQDRDVLIADSLRRYLGAPESALRETLPADSLRAIAASRERNLNAIAASALIRRALRLEPERRWGEMAALLTRAIRINPESVSGERLLGGVYQRMDRLPEARAHYEAALRLDPEDVPSLRGLATWHLVRSELPEARSLFRSVLALRPDDVDAHNNLGVTLGRLGDLEGARSHFREAARLRPGDADALLNLRRAEAALAQGRGTH
jgi:Flp pilus assembly protein TadD